MGSTKPIRARTPAEPNRRPAAQPRLRHHRPHQMSYHPDTRDYLQRRIAEGNTKREARRALKRYVYRSAFRQLQTSMA